MAGKLDSYLISGRVILSRLARPAKGYRVRAFDADHFTEDDCLGEGVTDKAGNFQIKYNENDFVKNILEAFLEGGPDIVLQVLNEDGELLTSTPPRKGASRFESFHLEIALPASKSLSLAELGKNISIPNKLKNEIKKLGLTQPADLLSVKGLKAVKESGLKPPKQAEFLSAIKFAAAGAKGNLIKNLQQSGVTSLFQLARLPATQANAISKQLSEQDQIDFIQLKDKAHAFNNAMTYTAAALGRSNARDAKWLEAITSPSSTIDPGSVGNIGDVLVDLGIILPTPVNDENCSACEDCEHVFSPFAYVVDLLDFIQDMWSVDVDTLESILFQDIKNLNCTNGMDTVPQIELGIGVLERYGQSRGMGNVDWQEDFKSMANRVLDTIDFDSNDNSWHSQYPQLHAATQSSQPTGQTTQNLIVEARAIYTEAINSRYPLLSDPPNNASDEELSNHEREQNARASERGTLLQEFEERIAQIVSNAFQSYRTQLIETIGETADKLERRLFIDLRSAPCHRSNRVLQLIQSLQSFVLSVQTGDVEQIKKTGHLQPLIGDHDFEAIDESRWNWLSSYSTWASAMYVLVYPENLLMPPMLRSHRTPTFQKAMDRMMTGSNSEVAEQALEDYEEEVKEFASRGFEFKQCFLDSKRLIVFGSSGANLFLNVMDRYPERWSGWRKVKDWDPDHIPYQIRYIEEGELSGGKHAGKFIVRALLPGQFYGLDESIARHYVLIDLFGNNEETFSTTPITSVSNNNANHEESSTESLATIFDSLPSASSSVMPAGSVAGFDSKVNVKVNDTYWQVDIDFDGAGEDPSSTAMEQFQIETWRPISSGGNTYYLFVFGKDRSVTFGGYVTIVARFSQSSRIGDWKVLSGTLRNLGAPTGHYTGPAIPPPAKLHNRSRHIYYVERYLHLPMMMGWMLNQAGDYSSAHDWYRKIYDPFLPVLSRPRFPFKDYFDQPLDRPENWLDHARDPHGIASKRRGAYLKATVLLMVKNLLDWADHEFALFNAESINRARKLYLMAERILQAPALDNPCHTLQQSLEFEITARFGESAEPVMEEIRRIESMTTQSKVKKAVDSLRKELKKHSSPSRFRKKAKQYLDRVMKDENRSSNELFKFYEKHSTIVEEIEDALAVTNLGRDLLGRDHTNISEDEPLPPPTPKSLWFCIPPNPLLAACAFRASVGLEKLRTCRNLAGEISEAPPLPGEGTGTTAITNIGELTNPEDIIVTTPPRFRFSYLLQMARQQAQLAQQLGSSLLTTIEKRDSARLELLTAEHNAGVSKATVQLKDLGIDAAKRAHQVSNIQKQRAHSQQSFWQDRVYRGGDPFGLGLSQLEMAALLTTGTMAAIQNIELGIKLGTLVGGSIGATLAGSATAIPGALVSGGVGGLAGLPGGATGGAIGAVAGVALIPALAAAAATLPTIASYERRAEDWRHELNLSKYDAEISEANLRLSGDQLKIARQDKTIADLQDQHAVAVLEFLRNEKVANEALFDVMVDILLENYRTVMQIATSTAQLAQNTLEFETQEKLHLVQGNYWSVNREELTPEQKDLGLLGAERLLTSLVRLENHKLESEKRFLNIKKTISLANHVPTEFVNFKQTGEITFTTHLEWFDRDFPGHYRRLIKNVEVTIVALTPPVDGIHAMLKNHGSSTIEIKREGNFIVERTFRAFNESIALDSPFNDSGISQLQPEDHLLRPFEGLGVETGWTLELPKANNRFHFETIMDVYFTIEYSALHDEMKKQQVNQRLGDVETADVVFSLKVNYSDLWYHLFNPGSQQNLEFEMVSHAFPPNLKLDPANLRPLKELTVVFEAAEGETIPDEILQGFKLKKDGHEIDLTAHLEGQNGMFSTRHPNAQALPNSLNPEGKWELLVDGNVYNTENNKKKIDRLANILIVLTVQGTIDRY